LGQIIIEDLVIPAHIAHPDGGRCARCRDCGRTAHDFYIPNKIWNHVIADIHPDSYPDGVVPSEGAGGVWCYDCFCERAGKKGYVPVFRCELIHPYNSLAERVNSDDAT